MAWEFGAGKVITTCSARYFTDQQLRCHTNTQMIKYADATPADYHVGSYQCSNAHVRDRNIEYCTETLKASQVIDYTAQSWWEELGPNSVDVLTPTNDSLEH